MTHPGNGCHVAQWSEKDREVLTILSPDGNLVESLRIAPAGDLPYPQMLWQTGWVPYPGSEWQEEPPGQWTRAIFPDTDMARKR
jgi:hypothetical protein